MDNQQKQATLRPSQDFKPGQRITFRDFDGTVIVSKFPDSPYPIVVKLDGIDYEYYFTPDGRYTQDGTVELFRLEESDKLEQATNDSKLFALLQTLLNTKTNTLSRIEDELQYLVDKELVNQTEKWFIEVNSEVRLLKYLISECQGLEKGE